MSNSALRARVVDRDDREAELAGGLERAQPHDAAGRLLGAADDRRSSSSVRLGVERRDEVGAVVHRQLRPRVEHRLDVAVVGRHVLAVDRVDGGAVALDERGGDVVLRGERVGGAQRDLAPRPRSACARGSPSRP